MKPLLLIACLFYGNYCNAQFSSKKVKKELVRVNDSLYASKFEVSNAKFKEFLSSTWIKEHPEYKSIAFVDTARWSDEAAYYEPYADHYFQHPAYANYPVVNISHKAAEVFCQWLTYEYNLNSKEKLLFSLPTEKEWIQAAQAGNLTAKYGFDGNDFFGKNYTPKCNFKQSIKDSTGKTVYYGSNENYVGILSLKSDNADVTATVKSYESNKIGLYNMSGNVSEMVKETSFVKGGSWNDSHDNLTVNARIPYSGKAKRSIGFRYFAKVQ